MIDSGQNPFRRAEVGNLDSRARGSGLPSAQSAVERCFRWIWAGGALLLPLVLWTDGRLIADAASWRTPALNRVMEGLTFLGLGGVDIGILAGLALLGRWLQSRELWTRGLVGAATVASAGIVDQLFKNVLCRARPSAPGAGAFFVNFPCFPARYAVASFPSGHATTAFAAAVLLTLWYPRSGGVFVGVAALVAMSRVLLGAHFPSDVLGGALLGSGVALAVHAYFPTARRPSPDLRSPSPRGRGNE